MSLTVPSKSHPSCCYFVSNYFATFSSQDKGILNIEQENGVYSIHSLQGHDLNEARFTLVFEYTGADPGFFLGGGALVSRSTSTPINHIVFFLQSTSCIRKPQVISGGGGVRTPCTLPLDPPQI